VGRRTLPPGRFSLDPGRAGWQRGAVQLNPRYGDDPVVVVEGDPTAIAGPVVRQRRRFVEELGRLSDDQWAQASRCEGWSARDVIVHLDSTNTFWTFSLSAGRAGEPTRFLATFDPVASPAELVAAAGAKPPEEVLASFSASTEAFAQLVESFTDDEWTLVAESPPGHVSATALAHHALWDSWVHERDVLLPLGRTPAEEPDEVAACLRYAAALAPGLALTNGVDATGTLALRATDPDLAFVVEVDGRVTVRDGAPTPADPIDLTLTGGAVDLVEALSMRRPLDADVPADAAWLVQGLADVFETDPDRR